MVEEAGEALGSLKSFDHNSINVLHPAALCVCTNMAYTDMGGAGR
jgi:hypothetical protein